jgi:hypothetical protein
MPWNVRKNPCWISFFGLNLTLDMPWLVGIPRRLPDYSNAYAGWNVSPSPPTYFLGLLGERHEEKEKSGSERISLHGLQTYCQWLWLGLYRRSLWECHTGVLICDVPWNGLQLSAASSEFSYYTNTKAWSSWEAKRVLISLCGLFSLLFF